VANEHLRVEDDAWDALNESIPEFKADDFSFVSLNKDSDDSTLHPSPPCRQPFPRLPSLLKEIPERRFSFDPQLLRPPPGLSADLVLPCDIDNCASQAKDVAEELEKLTLEDDGKTEHAQPRYGPRAAAAQKAKAGCKEKTRGSACKEKKRVSFGGVEIKDHPSREELWPQKESVRQRRKTPDLKRVCRLGSRCKFDSNCPYLHPRRDLRNSLGNSDFYALRPLIPQSENRRLSWTPGTPLSSLDKAPMKYRL
jgi:hypothetical protein